VDNQVIYYNANIHTMDNISARGCSGVSSGEGRAPVRASAIAVRDDKIVAVGVYADVESALAGSLYYLGTGNNPS
jgi:predicted amidohydrolase YtcJ